MSTTVAEVDARVDALSANADQIWILLCGFLVFWMHAGFAMLEAGSVRRKNTINILFKNVGTVAISAIMYFFLGYSFAYGDLGRENDFIGSGDYALYESQNSNKHNWFFQFAFAATASTILSGAIAGRAKLEAYFFACAIITAFIYPVVSHWVWSPQGWLSAFKTDRTRVIGHKADENACGFIDYAGSGVVHLTGGVSGFVGAAFVGARAGRWATPELFAGHNYPLCAIGVLILWFGWYGFNCGSTLAFDGNIASKVAVTTTLSPSSACLTGMMIQLGFTRAFENKWQWDLVNALNCVLAGLVSITAGCSVVHDWHAIFIGMLGAMVYMGASQLMKTIHIDDPVDAVAVHGFCGIWGCLAVGIFAEPSEIMNAYSLCTDANGNRNGVQFAVQLSGVLAIIAWAGVTVSILFLLMKFTIGLRVSEEEEEAGLDASEHGAMAYEADIKGTDMEMQKASVAEKKADGPKEV
mmetsp:Transcript_27548/g.51401  ORF Transcript_27548/g.51401 Transcript_27548/m.51401 type:complete len:468 (-) Transcript_27548:177-1580(-)|eukprot:CAMPEP_0170175918 /NCGR_PEP_ID=MMETSP0040_2-20121228/8898_1 /TAXON_ID=641309 /ORGANISM="Lotharella oceanica, Strain CCMP622" /LENGTH=467 /DNA_ID=CAMNT_0010418061 /DNA_START=15 /DNA_END=1418 /DNA_ORIENTATION=-